ncbi:hypothetical protein ACA910_010183 [Epithemia clementina (nom. ined.)]
MTALLRLFTTIWTTNSVVNEPAGTPPFGIKQYGNHASFLAAMMAIEHPEQSQKKMNHPITNESYLQQPNEPEQSVTPFNEEKQNSTNRFLVLTPSALKMIVHNEMKLRDYYSLIKMMERPEDQNDVYYHELCFEGRPMGRTFNWVILLANSIHYSTMLMENKKDKNSINEQNSNEDQNTANSLVGLDKNTAAFHEKWFDPDPFYFQPLYNSGPRHNNDGQQPPVDMDHQPNNRAALLCRTTVNTNKIFYNAMHFENFNFDRSTSLLYGYLPGLIHLKFKKEWIDAAQHALDQYVVQGQNQQLLDWFKQAPADQEETDNEKDFTLPEVRPLIVTVHQRWLEGSCVQRAKRLTIPCPMVIPQVDPLIQEEYFFAHTCFFNETFVRTKLPTVLLEGRDPFDPNQVIVVLMADGQRSKEDDVKSFALKDSHDFMIQVGMMMLSDYHFGNPMSSIDKVLSHWRARLGKKTYPEEWYQEVWDAVQQDLLDGFQSLKYYSLQYCKLVE